MIALMMYGCAVSSQFEGPGWADGEMTLDHDGPFVVAATYGRTYPGQDDAFGDHVDAIVESLDAMDEESGLVGYALRGEIGGRDNWTVSVWTTEEAMLEFVVSDVHLAAMADVDVILEETAFAHWEEPDSAALPPDWDQVRDQLETTEASY